jgi:hypothetical protein
VTGAALRVGRGTETITTIRRIRFEAFQLLCKDRYVEVARLHALRYAKLQHFHDFLHRCTAFNALTICRGVPGAYMCVYEASKAMLSSSTSFGGSTPLPYIPPP